MDLRR